MNIEILSDVDFGDVLSEALMENPEEAMRIIFDELDRRKMELRLKLTDADKKGLMGTINAICEVTKEGGEIF